MRVTGLAIALLSGTLALAADNQTSSGGSSETAGSTGAPSSNWQGRPMSASGSGQSSQSSQSHFTQDQYGSYDSRYNWRTSDSSFDSWAKDVQSGGTNSRGGA